MAERITISVKLSPELWKEVQHRCIDENIEYSQYVERALIEFMKKNKPLKSKTSEDLEVELFGEGMRDRTKNKKN